MASRLARDFVLLLSFRNLQMKRRTGPHVQDPGDTAAADRRILGARSTGGKPHAALCIVPRTRRSLQR